MQQIAAQKRLQQTQAQVDEVYINSLFCAYKQLHHLLLLKVVGIMRVNVEKVLEREQKLSELDDRAGKESDKVMTPEQRAPQLPTVLNFLN